MTILAGDLGGTKTVLALYWPNDPIDQPYRSKKFPSGEYLWTWKRSSESSRAKPANAASGGVRCGGPIRWRQGPHHQPALGDRPGSPLHFPSTPLPLAR